MATKRERVMTCWMCPRYNREERFCRDGKTNPKKKTDTVAVAELLGLESLCHYNPYRDALALRKYFPHHPATIAASQPGRRSRRDAEPAPSTEENRSNA
jgi:hypothetical protein